MYNEQKNARIAVNKSLLKEFFKDQERIVYMNDNTEFQIQLFNPYSYTIGCAISINGNMMPNYIVVKPGQRLWLERYLNEARKFLFETYEVNGNSKEVKKAIAKNGIIEIHFYKERTDNNWWNNGSSITSISTSGSSPDIVWYDGDGGLRKFPNTVTCLYSGVTTGDCIASATSTAGSFATMDGLDYLPAPEPSVSSVERLRSLETGRVEKGGQSNQKLVRSDISFESFYFRTEKIHILPMSMKQINASDLKKIYCHECGRKLNTKYKFCPYCGTKL